MMKMCTINLKAIGHKGQHNAVNKMIKQPGCECVKIIYLNIYLFLSSVCSYSVLSDCLSSCSCEFQRRSVFLKTNQQAARWRILKYDIQEKWVHDKIHNRIFHFCQTGPDDTLEGAAWASLLSNNTKTINLYSGLLVNKSTHYLTTIWLFCVSTSHYIVVTVWSVLVKNAVSC